MTPVEELRTAAERLKKLTAQATEPPWTTNWNAQEYELVAPSKPYPIAEWTYAIATTGPKVDEQRADCDTADADYIAAIGPEVGALLADWLEATAAEMSVAEGTEYLLPGDSTGFDSWNAALAIARALNAGSQP